MNSQSSNNEVQNQSIPSVSQNRPEPVAKKKSIWKLFLILIIILFVLVGSYFVYNSISPKDFHEISVVGVGKEDKGQIIATFMLRDDWVSKPGAPDNTGFSIELFPSEAEYLKALSELKKTSNNTIWPFRIISGSKLASASSLSSPEKIEKFKTVMAKINGFDKFVVIDSPNVKVEACYQLKKDSLVGVHCIFQTQNDMYFGLDLHTNNNNLNSDFETYKKIIQTIK